MTVGASPGETPAPSGATGSIAGGGGWHVVSHLVPQLYTLVVSVVAARVLGPGTMGKQSYIAFFTLTLVSLATGGVNVSLLRYVGELSGRGRHGVVDALVRLAWRIELVLAVAGSAVLVATGAVRAELRSAWSLAAVVAVAAILHSVPASVLYGLQRWRDAAIVGISTGALSTVATVVVLAAGGGIVGMFAVEAAFAVVNLAWTSRLARRAAPQPDSSDHLEAELRRAFRRYAQIVSVDVILTYVVW